MAAAKAPESKINLAIQIGIGIFKVGDIMDALEEEGRTGTWVGFAINTAAT